MPDLPFEIWAYIASLLPSDVLMSVQFSLNRAFLEFGLEQRYRSAYFGDFANPQTFNAFKRLRDPTRAARVRQLTFRNETFPVKLKSSMSTYQARTKPKKPRWKLLGSRKISPATQAPEISEKDFLEIVSKMTNLESFTLESSQPHLPDESDPRQHCSETLVRSTLHSFSRTLQTLQLTLSVSAPEWALPTSTLLTSLRYLTIGLDQLIFPMSPHSDSEFGNSLVPFVNAHRETIESLELGLYMCAFLNLAAVLDPLEPFPQLTALSVTQTFPSNFIGIKDEGKDLADAIHSFIQRCSPKLARLEVVSWPRVITCLASQPFTRGGTSKSKLPLQTLKIRLETGMPEDRLSPPQLCTLVHPIRSTLVDLDLSRLRLEASDLKLFFPGASPSPLLKRLAVELTLLEPEVFTYLSVALPELKTLAIGYCYLSAPAPWTPTGYPATTGIIAGFRLPTIEFCKCLQSSCHFDDWDLEHLRLKWLQTMPWDSCKKAITDAFPKVKTFNGASREEYLSPNNMDNI